MCCSSPCFCVLPCTHFGPLQCFLTYFRKLKEIGVLRSIIPVYVISCDYDLKDQIKAYKINDNMQELSIEKSEDLILPRERVKFLESENKFSKDDIFNKQKLIDKLLENNNKLADHQSHHVPIQ